MAESQSVHGPFLTHSEEWRKGFEVGASYILMAQQCPLVGGLFFAENDEQLFLLGHWFGYGFEWSQVTPTHTTITFTLKESGDRE